MPSYLYTHLHRNSRVALIPFNNEILSLKALNITNILSFPPNRRKLLGLSPKLHLESIDMISIHVRVPELNDQLVRVCRCNLRDHVCEERVGCNVEWDA